MTDHVRTMPHGSPFEEVSDLSDRPAGYSVIGEVLRVQESMEPQNILHQIFGFRPVHPHAKSWFSGAIGERKVGDLLLQLGPEWAVLHSVPVGKGDSDIDHVVIGPAGVFTINTKRHPGKNIWVGERMIMVAGQKTDHLRNSRHEAKRAAKLLTQATGIPVDAHPVLAIVEPASFTFRQRPADVSIMDARRLPRWLKRRRAVLDPDTLARVIHAALESRTWHATADLSIDPASIERFVELQRKDNRAYLVRLAWSLGISIAAGGAAILLLTSLTTGL